MTDTERAIWQSIEGLDGGDLIAFACIAVIGACVFMFVLGLLDAHRERREDAAAAKAPYKLPPRPMVDLWLGTPEDDAPDQAALYGLPDVHPRPLDEQWQEWEYVWPAREFVEDVRQEEETA